MEEVKDLLYEGLVRYFTVLRNTGYIPQQDVYRLLTLSFIHKFLHECEGFITEEDCNTLARIIGCMSDNSCLIPYACHISLTEPVLSSVYNFHPRITEDGDIRDTEQGNIRITQK